LPRQAERFGVEIIEGRHFRPGCVPRFEGRSTISIDMDGFDPSCAPGVSHLEPGGLTARDLTDVLLAIETGSPAPTSSSSTPTATSTA
jgi:arginase family enzyme